MRFIACACRLHSAASLTQSKFVFTIVRSSRKRHATPDAFFEIVVNYFLLWGSITAPWSSTGLRACAKSTHTNTHAHAHTHAHVPYKHPHQAHNTWQLTRIALYHVSIV